MEDPHYPQYDVKLAISQDYLFNKKYTDVADQSANDLVQYIDKKQEDHFDYNYYTGASKVRFQKCQDVVTNSEGGGTLVWRKRRSEKYPSKLGKLKDGFGDRCRDMFY